jgi:hypothetical protein
MDISKSPETTASAPLLAQAHRHLTIAFFLNILLNIATYAEEQAAIQISLELSFVLVVASLIASIYMCVALYIAATRLGFGKMLVILSMILTIFIPLLGLILVVSADIRLAKALKAKGWNVGLLGAKAS